jgi:predicted nucleic-acid-binding Zn-ribbon protein
MENANQDNASTKPGVICPKCGSTNIIFSALQFLVGPPYNITCKDCSYNWKHDTKISFDQPVKLNFFQRLVEKIWKF